MPVIAQKILAIAGDDTASVSMLESIIENDPAISAKILSVSNSAFYGFKTPANTLGGAIVRIGFSNVKNIALGISLMTVLHNGKTGTTLDYHRIFNHSVATGFIASLLSRSLKLNVSEETLICGMLHDIGFLVLSSHFNETYLKVMDVFKGEMTLLEAEREIFGFTHSDIGKWLAEKWSLPDTVTDVILNHHCPLQANENRLQVALVHTADVIATRSILSVTRKNPQYPFEHKCLETLGISDADIHQFEEQIKSGELLSDLFTI